MDPRTPVAIIENGWTADQRLTRGTIADIAERAGAAGVQNPAVIVIGDVAAMGTDLA
jgi:uroporphyrin-III C-methyltransferase/precorrin-2 dehydrogenase/sirohydrochlorin ferrochelatase